MKKQILVSLVAILAATTPAYACDMQGKDGIVKENNLNISVDAKRTGGITKDEFFKVIEDVTAIYRPIIAAKGKKLVVVKKWDDGTVNAYAQQAGNNWKVSMFGGLARHDAITADGFAVVLCHEIGHHIGGTPKKKSFWSTSWASNEGQSDYFGTSKCLRKYMEGQDNETIVANMDIPEIVNEKCLANHATAGDITMCKRGAMAGLSLGNLFKALRNLSTDLKFDTPDTSVVVKTNHSHPAPQCRLDTYFAGSICDKSSTDDVSNSDYTQGTCTKVESYTDGTRPQCWYKAPRS